MLNAMVRLRLMLIPQSRRVFRAMANDPLTVRAFCHSRPHQRSNTIKPCTTISKTDKTLVPLFFDVFLVVSLTVLPHRVIAKLLQHYPHIVPAVRLAHFPCFWNAATRAFVWMQLFGLPSTLTACVTTMLYIALPVLKPLV